MFLVSSSVLKTNNLYNTSNAASPYKETNSVTGTDIIVNSGTWASITSSPTPIDGLYALSITSSAGTNTPFYGRIELGLPTNTEVEIKFHVAETIGTNGDIIIFEGEGFLATLSYFLATSSFTEFITYNKTNSNVNYIRVGGSNNADTGNTTTIDNIIITAIDPSYVDPNEIHTQLNAAAAAINNSTDSTTGWGVGGSAGSLSTTTNNTYSGSFALVMTAGDTNAERAEYSFSVTTGDTFNIRIWGRKGDVSTGSGPYTGSWTGLTGSPGAAPFLSSSSYTYLEYNVTANLTGTAILRFYAGSTPAVGDQIVIGKLSIIKTN
jgi:hypothetical protein